MKPRHVIIGMVVMAAFTGLNSLLGNVVADDVKNWVGKHPWVVWVLFLVTGAVALVFQVLSHLRGVGDESQVKLHPDLESRNRWAMLQKVRTIWITGVLQPSLFNDTLLKLGLVERPEAITPPMDLLLQRTGFPDRPLPPHKGITDIFDELGHALLILGAPGAGKTTLLLELAKELLDRADEDPSHPIPVVFLLSTWAEAKKQPSLEEWLVEELRLRYQVPHRVAQGWIRNDQILPLLDGLDEVALVHRAECAEAINAFRQNHGLLPLGVCSRIGDYEALRHKLRLQGAVVVQPLDPQQVDTYLKRGGKSLAAVRAMLRDDEVLQELLDTPLMLSIMVLAYAGKPVEDLQETGSLEVRRCRLFAAYVDRMLQHGRADTRWRPEQTKHWLAWLAWQMSQHDQTAFYLEAMQPDWLPRKQQRVPTKAVAVLCASLGCLLLSIFAWAAFAVGHADLYLIGAPLLGAAIMASVGYSASIRSVERVSWSWSRVRSHIGGPRQWIGWGVLWLVYCGFLALTEGPLALIAGPTLGLAAILYCLARGLRLSDSEVRTRVIPNQGIRRSARNALVSLTCFLLVVMLGLAVDAVYGSITLPSVLGVLAAFLFIGGGFALPLGGRSYLQHLALRSLLIRNGCIPRNYEAFLDYAASRLFLRRVGGGYIFVHRLLQDQFAAQYRGPGTEKL
jgi:DNA polymerase III delta prime subunit